MPSSELPRLGYGAANVGNLYRAMNDEQALAVLEAAWQSGVRYFDTAPHYGLGLSERRLGAFLATKPRDAFVLSTKVGRLLAPASNPQGALDLAHDFAVPANLERRWDFTRDGIRRSLDASLERLGLDYVDVIFLHDPEKHDLDAADRDAYPSMITLRDEGLVGSVGVGSMSIDALSRASRYAGLDLLMVAGRLTLAEQPASTAVIPYAVQNGMRIVAAGVFNSGLLATNTPGARYEYGVVPEGVVQRVSAIAELCRAHGVDLPTAALQYPLRMDQVTTVVVGGSTPEQVAENSRRLEVRIPDALWSDLAEQGLTP